MRLRALPRRGEAPISNGFDLTLRPERLDQSRKWRKPRASQSVSRGVRFISIEPLIDALGPIDLSAIDWVIVGGESGPGHKPV
jgi:protein gp37